MWTNVGFLVGKQVTAQEKTNNALIKNWYNDSIVPYHTSIDVYGESGYNLLAGIVIGVSTGIEKVAVTIRISSDYCMRYGNLKNVKAVVGDAVQTHAKLGDSYNGYVSFEYCTTIRSKFVVRAGDNTYFKHDPYDFLINDIFPEIPNYSYDYVKYKYPDLAK